MQHNWFFLTALTPTHHQAEQNILSIWEIQGCGRHFRLIKQGCGRLTTNMSPRYVLVLFVKKEMVPRLLCKWELFQRSFSTFHTSPVGLSINLELTPPSNALHQSLNLRGRLLVAGTGFPPEQVVGRYQRSRHQLRPLFLLAPAAAYSWHHGISPSDCSFQSCCWICKETNLTVTFFSKEGDGYAVWPTRAQLDQIDLTIFSQKSHQNWPCDREAMLISNKWSKKQPMPKTYISVWSFKRDCSENWYSRTFQVARRKADHHGSGFGHPQPEHPPRPVLHVPRLAQDHPQHHPRSSQGPPVRICKVCQGRLTLCFLIYRPISFVFLGVSVCQDAWIQGSLKVVSEKCWWPRDSLR